jgi:hypothetical protein
MYVVGTGDERRPNLFTILPGKPSPHTLSTELKYILIFQYTLQCMPNTLQYLCKSLNSFNICYDTIIILWYASIYFHIWWIVLKLLYTSPLCLITLLFYKIFMAPHYSKNIPCTCYGMFVRIQQMSPIPWIPQILLIG